MHSCPPLLSTSASFLSAQSQVPSTPHPQRGKQGPLLGAAPPRQPPLWPQASCLLGPPQPVPILQYAGFLHSCFLSAWKTMLPPVIASPRFLSPGALVDGFCHWNSHHLFAPLTMRSSGAETASESCFYPKCLEQCVAQHGTNEGTNESIKGKEGTIVHN